MGVGISIDILDAMGRRLFHRDHQFIDLQYEFSLPVLSEGVYILRLSTGVKLAARRFVVKSNQ